MVAGVVLAVAGCGGDGPSAAPATGDGEVPAVAATGSTDAGTIADDSSAPGEVDATELAPGTALLVVEGEQYRFMAGGAGSDVCRFEPEFDLGEAKMDLVAGPTAGTPHLQVLYGGDKQVVVMVIPPNIAYIAGKGEETDSYFRTLGIVPPEAGPIDVDGNSATGLITMANVETNENVQASFAVRCE